jgi:glycosyltransferase involved in cell wall biosynthesis
MDLLIVVITYEAASFVEGLLDRVPATVAGVPATILVADDHSNDGTDELVGRWAARHPERDVRTIRHERNLGYGGNQAACYAWAAREGFDAVVLLHGDAQYQPEMIEHLVRPILDGSARAAFGSRMIEPGGARRGGMPIVRWMGNRALTVACNRLSGEHFSEWFSGFRAYRVDALVAVEVDDLPRDFSFDVALMQRLLLAGVEIREISIPTRYGDEVSRVPLVRFGLQVVASAVRHRRAHRHRHAAATRPMDAASDRRAGLRGRWST